MTYNTDVLIIGLVINLIFVINDWYTLAAVSLITAVLGILINIFIIFNRDARVSLVEMIIRRGK